MKFVKSSHFINPHLFWCYPVDEPNDAYIEIDKLEAELKLLFSENDYDEFRKMEVGAQVAVKLLCFDKYIRGTILCVKQKGAHMADYIVWATDYGYPLCTNMKFVHPLPVSCTKLIERVVCVGIAGVVPAVKCDNIMDFTTHFERTENWSKRACEVFERVLNEAFSIVLVERFKTDGHCWADLHITNHLGRKIYASEYLCKLDMAMRVGPELRVEWSSLSTIVMPPWLSNNGRPMWQDNKHCDRPKAPEILKKNNKLEEDPYAQVSVRKVEEWCSRNKQLCAAVGNVQNEIADESWEASECVQNDKSFQNVAAMKCGTHDEAGLVRKSSMLSRLQKMQMEDSQQLPNLIACNMETSSKRDLSVLSKPKNDTGISNITQLDSNDSYGLMGMSSVRSMQQRPQMQQSPPVEAFNVDRPTERDLFALTAPKQAVSPEEALGAAGPEAARAALSPTKKASEIKMSCVAAHRERLMKMRLKFCQEYKETPSSDVGSERSEEVEHPNLAIQQSFCELYERSSELATKNQSLTSENADFGLLHKKLPLDAPRPQNVELPDFKKTRENYIRKGYYNEISTMPKVPAGFDVTKLRPYKNETTHWHRKTTTRNDSTPKNAMPIENTFSGQTANAADQQDFRFTRVHSDKYKRLADHTIWDGQRSKLKTDAAKATMFDVNEKAIADTAQETHGQLDTSQLDESVHQRSDIGEIEEIDQTASPQVLTDSNQDKGIGQNESSHSIHTDDELVHERSDIGEIEEIDQTASPQVLTDSNQDKGIGQNESSHSIHTNDELVHERSDIGEIEEIETASSHELTDSNQDKGSDQNETENSKASVAIGVLTMEHISEFWEIGRPDSPSQSKDLKCTLNKVGSEESLRLSFVNRVMLHHSARDIPNVLKFAEVPFTPIIHDRLQSIRITQLFRIQSFAWPHIIHGCSVVAINPRRTGKTWAYLPALCSLVSHKIKDTPRPKEHGPHAIVLVPTTKCVEEVTLTCRYLLDDLTHRTNGEVASNVVPCFGPRKETDVKLQLFNGCGILVATPSSLLRLLNNNEQDSLLHSNRFKRLVIDDLDVITARSNDDFQELLRKLYKIPVKTDKGTQLQLVVTSSKWDKPVIVGLLKRCLEPLLLIGDYLEAALYGRAKMLVKLVERDAKVAAIRQFFEESPENLEFVLIMCNLDSEVEFLKHALSKCEYTCLGYMSKSTQAERVCAMEWNNRLNRTQILVSSDYSFLELNVNRVKNLIHYSFPNSWTKFTARFTALLHSYENRVQNMFAPSTLAKQQVTSLILFDEGNSAHLPRFVEFLNRQNRRLPAEILLANDQLLLNREDNRSSRCSVICSNVLEFGECDETQCTYRHNLTYNDRMPPNGDIPTTGEIRVHILKVFSPSHYSARLLEHKAPGTTQWRELRQPSADCVFGMQLTTYYTDADNRVLYWPPKMNDICIYCTEQEYQRVRILELPELDNVDIVQSVQIVVKLIDVGSVVNAITSDLLVCAEKFRDYPPLAMDIRLSGVLPFDNDRTWDTKARRSVKAWIKTGITETDLVHVVVDFALANTIWVTQVIVMEKLPTLRRYVYRIDVKNSLINKHMAVRCSTKHTGIFDIAVRNRLIDYVPAESIGDSAVKHQGGHTLAEDSQLVVPDAAMQDEDRDAADELSQQPSILSTSQSAVESPDAASKASNIDDTIESWCALPRDEMQLVEILEDGDWNEIYLLTLNFTNSSDRYGPLLVLIEEHVERQKKLGKHCSFPLLPMQPCILKHGDIYARAKLLSIFGDLHRFVLCDYATFVDVPSQALCTDCVYETTEHIVAFMPYKTIHCTLAGIQWPSGANCDRKAFTRRYQHVYVVGENVAKTEADSFDWHKLGINSYKVLLYESDRSDDLTGATMLNTSLLDRGAAMRDPDTEHFLTYSPSIDFGSFELKNPEELLRYATGKDSAFDLAKVKVEELYNCFLRSCELGGNDDGISILNNLALTETDEQASNMNNKEEKQQSKVKTSEAKSKNSTEKAKDKSSIEPMSNSCNGGERLPVTLLSTPHKCPSVIWHETDCFIYLKIHAPDIDNYNLNVNATMVYFSAHVDGEHRVLLLNLLGNVQPQYVTHEIRGVKVLVRLLKSVFVHWPRLVTQSTHFSWLSYDLDALTMAKDFSLSPLQKPPLIRPQDWVNLGSDDEDDSDDGLTEKQMFRNFPDVNNNENEYDPIEELF